MALKKEIIFDNGVNVNYHRVDEINVDNKNKKLKVSVISYTDNTYRQKEINNLTNKDRYDELLNLIMQENQKSEDIRDIDQIKQWSDEANNLISEFREDINLSVLKRDFEFNEVNDFSMSNVYTLLKGIDIFKDAEDIL
jgi:hypothetical protein